jgi:hypothetical protein
MKREQWMWMQASLSLMAAAAAAIGRDAYEAGTAGKLAPMPASLRERSWRDLVRRLEKTLARRGSNFSRATLRPALGLKMGID